MFYDVLWVLCGFMCSLNCGNTVYLVIRKDGGENHPGSSRFIKEVLVTTRLLVTIT